MLLSLSAGKNGDIIQSRMDTRDFEKLYQHDFPVLDLCNAQEELWIASESSDLKSLGKGPSRVISGLPSVKSYSVVDNKKYVLTQNTSDEVEVWDLLKGKSRKTESSVESTLKQLSSGKPKPSWFSVNIRLGSLMLDFSKYDTHLCTEETPEGVVNYGVQMTKRIFHYWLKKQEEVLVGVPLTREVQPVLYEKDCGLEEFSMVISQIAGDVVEPIYRNTVGELGSLTQFNEIPIWLEKLLLQVNIEKASVQNIQFTLEPMHEKELSRINEQKLVAPGSVKVKKILDHVIKNLQNPPALPEELRTEEKIELISKSYILNAETTLALIKSTMFRPNEEVVFLYRVKPSAKL